jgi:hypothetical protein
MDIPNQKLERKMMAENTVAMTITDDGYRQIAEMTIINVLDNVKTNKDWSRKDAALLIMGAMMIVRHLTDDEFNLLTTYVEQRYDNERR